MLGRLIRLAVAVVLMCALLPMGTAAAIGDLVINEFSVSTTGTDVEFLEVLGSALTDYSDYTILEIEGDVPSQGVVDEVISVGTTDANGFWLANLLANTIENGSVTLLLVQASTATLNQDLDSNNDGVLDVTPWSLLVDSVGVDDGGGGDQTYGTPELTAGYDGLAYAPGGASRIPDGTDTNAATDWVRNDFDLAGIPGQSGTPVVGEAYNTPGEPNEAVAPPEPADPVINEFSADTVGDDYEYVEILGDPNTNYAGYTLLEIEGDDARGSIEEVVGLGTTNAEGYLLMALTTNSLENGTMSLLLVRSFSGFLGDDIDTNDDGVVDVTPWAELVDSVAVNDGGAGDLTYYGPPLGPNFDGLDASEPGGASRIPDGTDTETTNDWKRNDFDLAGIPTFTGTPVYGEARNTPEAANEAVPEACGDAFTRIYSVQGTGAASPLVGNQVAVEGVVVGDFQVGGLDGYFLQDAAGDGSTLTSDGIFVSAPGGTAVNPGELVRVRGLVSEAGGRTQIAGSQVLVCSSGHSVAATAISLPMVAADAFEKYEGMLVILPQALFISEYFNFDRYGEIVLTSARQDTPTAVVEPGPAAVALAAANALDRITLDDGRTTENPDPARHPNGSNFDLSNRFRGGDTVAGVTGGLDYSDGKYRIQPTAGATYTAANARPASPAAVGGTIKVASFNVLNYFTTLNSRGANTAEEFTRQRTKIIAALAAINADVVGLIEIENNWAAVADLVSGLNAEMGAGTYAYIDTGVIGSDQIKVALIYKPATVTPVGDHAILDNSFDTDFRDTKNRPVLAQTFRDEGTYGLFTVAVNHLKSKGSDCNDVGDPDLGDGAGNCNLTRKAAAEVLVDWLATDPTGSGDEDFLIIGDLNSYDKEDPIDALVAGGYTDLVAAYQGEHAYTYVFDGQLGYLDYALAGAALMEEVTGATVWHINADEPDLLDYDMTYKQPAQDALYEPNAYRSSDHDAVVVGLDLETDVGPGPFGKLTPIDGATKQGLSVTLTWQAAPTAGDYWYCYDTTDDDLCSNWVHASTPSATVSGLAYSTTYYWQVKAGNDAGITYADGAAGAYWSFSTHTLIQETFFSLGTYDGWVLEQDDSGRGGTFDATATTARVGDDALNRQFRSILDFDTSALPDGAVITGVTLRVKRQAMVGTNPFDTHGLLLVDMKTGWYHEIQALEKYDFQAVGSRGNVGRFIKTPALGWYRAPLRARNYALVSLTGTTQFRLRFELDDNDNAVADYLSFYTGNGNPIDRPQLVVDYYVP